MRRVAPSPAGSIGLSSTTPPSPTQSRLPRPLLLSIEASVALLSLYRPSIEVGGNKTAVFAGAPSGTLHGHFFVVGQLIGHHRDQPHAPCFHIIFLDGIYRYHDIWNGFSRCIAISSPRWLFRHRAPGAIMGPTPPQCNLYRPKTITQQSTTYTEWFPPVGGGKRSIFDHGALIFIRFGG